MQEATQRANDRMPILSFDDRLDSHRLGQSSSWTGRKVGGLPKTGASRDVPTNTTTANGPVWEERSAAALKCPAGASLAGRLRSYGGGNSRGSATRSVFRRGNVSLRQIDA